MACSRPDRGALRQGLGHHGVALDIPVSIKVQVDLLPTFISRPQGATQGTGLHPFGAQHPHHRVFGGLKQRSLGIQAHQTKVAAVR